MKMKNNEKIIEMLTNYSNCYNLDKKLKNMVLENHKSILKVSFQIEHGYKSPIKIELDICITEKDDCIEEIVFYKAQGIKAQTKTMHFENHDGYLYFGSSSEVILINEKKEKIKIFIDYKQNICGYTSNAKGLDLKQYYKPNRGCSLLYHLFERYKRVNSPNFIFNSNCYCSLEDEISQVENNFNSDIETFWDDCDAKSEDEMIYLQNKSSGRKFEPDIPTERKFIDFNMPKLKY